MNRPAAAIPRLAAIALVGALCVAPIVWGFSELLRNPESFVPSFTSGTLERLWRSIACAVLVAAASTALGVLVGVSVGSLPRRFTWTSAALVSIPFVLPPYLYALAWIDVVGALNRLSGDPAESPAIELYSVQGVVLLQALRFTPIAAGVTLLAARFADSSALEASLISRGRAATFSAVFLPSARPLLLAGALAIALLALSDHAIASLLQVNLYPIDIQTRFSTEYNISAAYALTLPLLAIGLAATFGCFALMRRRNAFQSDTSGASGAAGLLPRSAAAACLATFAGSAVALPVAVVVYRIGSFTALRDAWNSTADEFALSAGVASASTAIAVALGLLCVQRFRRQWPFMLAASAPVLITGPAFGIGVILLWNHAGWRGAVYDSSAILVIIETGRIVFIALLGAVLGIAAQSRNLHDAALLSGASAWVCFARITVPLALPAIGFAGALAFLLAFADADAAALVAPPGATPLAVRIAGLMHYGPSELVHAASAFNAALAIALVSLAAFTARKWMAASS